MSQLDFIIRHARCWGVEDNSIFFPVAGEKDYQRKVQAAQVYCLSCLVQDECLAYAQDTEQPVGIWGGLTPRARKWRARQEAER